MSERTYSKLIRLPTFEERFRYLMLKGSVGIETFGADRYLNQVFYKSGEWLEVADFVIVRDNGCDLADINRPIQAFRFADHDRRTRDELLLVHHIVPITSADIRNRSRYLFDPDNLITTKHSTHNAIHYGDDSFLKPEFAIRTPGDTIPWRR